MQPDVQELRPVGELPREAQVLTRWRGIPGRVVVNEDERRGAVACHGAQDLAWMHQRGGLRAHRPHRPMKETGWFDCAPLPSP